MRLICPGNCQGIPNFRCCLCLAFDEHNLETQCKVTNKSDGAEAPPHSKWPFSAQAQDRRSSGMRGWSSTANHRNPTRRGHPACMLAAPQHKPGTASASPAVRRSLQGGRSGSRALRGYAWEAPLVLGEHLALRPPDSWGGLCLRCSPADLGAKASCQPRASTSLRVGLYNKALGWSTCEPPSLHAPAGPCACGQGLGEPCVLRGARAGEHSDKCSGMTITPPPPCQCCMESVLRENHAVQPSSVEVFFFVVMF